MAESQSQAEPIKPVSQFESITLENLNEFFAKGNDILDKLKVQVLAVPKQSECEWEEKFAAVKQSPVSSNTNIGVVGVTGSGKSSILNALLDHEVLVPTSCMSACTAAVIEVAWNESTEREFRAEIHFVTAEAWQADISAVLKDVDAPMFALDDENSEAGIAFKKITALYPAITKQSVKTVKPEELMNEDHVRQRLGQIINVHATSAKGMHDALSEYVEGKRKSSEVLLDSNVCSPSPLEDSIEYWPIVKKVRIYLRSSVLETGVVIADLPGVGDSNAARGTIAQRYLTHCANIWVVTPITRAVDDQVARNLLGESFKRQLRRDGMMSRVAFVCSRIGELVISELRTRLQLTSEFSDSMKIIDLERSEVGGRRCSKL